MKQTVTLFQSLEIWWSNSLSVSLPVEMHGKLFRAKFGGIFMSIRWRDFVDAFRVGSETGNIQKLADLLSDDFVWSTSDMDHDATLSWTANTSFRINGDAETLYENADIVAGTHPVLDDEGRQNLVMGVAHIKKGKIYRYDHMRKLADD